MKQGMAHKCGTAATLSLITEHVHNQTYYSNNFCFTAILQQLLEGIWFKKVEQTNTEQYVSLAFVTLCIKCHYWGNKSN